MSLCFYRIADLGLGFRVKDMSGAYGAACFNPPRGLPVQPVRVGRAARNNLRREGAYRNILYVAGVTINCSYSTD